jgi:hypothetical protein
MTLTEQMKADGWIEHDGGPCPVSQNARVRVLFKRPHSLKEWLGRADIFKWENAIAYYPEQPQ